jgi:MOSC domain-containing protein
VAVVRIDRTDSRCVVVNVDPATGRHDPSLLKVIGTTREARAGVYGTTVLPGHIRVGDPVVVERRHHVDSGDSAR